VSARPPRPPRPRFALPLADEPVAVAPRLHAVQLDAQHRLEGAWREIESYLVSMLVQGGMDPVSAEELTVLPGIEEVLALLAVREFAAGDQWDALVLDCAPTAETLRLLALPDALGWYLQRILPMYRVLARGARPLGALLGHGTTVPPDAVFEALATLAADLAAVRALLTDHEKTSLRLVLTPEAVVLAEARRTFTALALYGYQLDEVVANRIIPQSPSASTWQQGWIDSQTEQVAAIGDSFAGLPVRRASYLAAEPIGCTALRAVATELYGVLDGPAAFDAPACSDPLAAVEAVDLLSVTAVPAGSKDGEPEYVLRIALPLVATADVQASRSGDDLIVTVSGSRRILALPSVLRRCLVVNGSVADGRLTLRFRPDPRYWRPT
jgi:arsenite-transporting ATPase